MSKPLISRLLLENSNNSIQVPLDNIDQVEGLVRSTNILIEPWETPKVARDIYTQVETITRLGETDLPTRRQLFRKIIKGYDKKDSELAYAKLQIDQLEAKLE